MSRKDITDNYQVDYGKIVTPGKFEGQPLYAPYFWDAYMEGLHDDETEDGDISFTVNDEDIEEFPELTNVSEVVLGTDDEGFVSLMTVLAQVPA